MEIQDCRTTLSPKSPGRISSMPASLYLATLCDLWVFWDQEAEPVPCSGRGWSPLRWEICASSSVSVLLAVMVSHVTSVSLTHVLPHACVSVRLLLFL